MSKLEQHPFSMTCLIEKENIEKVIWIKSIAENQLIYLSPGFDNNWCYERHEFIYKNQFFQSTLHPHDVKYMQTIFSTRLDCSSPKQAYLYRAKTALGYYSWFLDTTYRLEIQGALEGFAGITEVLSSQPYELLAALNKLRPDLKLQEHSTGILSIRECECLKLYLKGHSGKIIAQLLNIQVKTYDNHIARIKDKFCTKSKAELIDKVFHSDYIFLFL